MENAIKRKINIFGKVGRIITTVIIVLLLIAEGALLAGTVVMAVLPKDVVSVEAAGEAKVDFDASYFGLDSGEITLNAGSEHVKVLGAKAESAIQSKDGKIELNASIGTFHFNLTDAIKIAAVGMIEIAAVIVALFFFKALMKEFARCDTPFNENVIKKMRTFAIALIPTMVISSIGNSLLGLLFHDTFSIGGVELMPLAFAAVVFVLTAIFKYGAQLQKEYDETV